MQRSTGIQFNPSSPSGVTSGRGLPDHIKVQLLEDIEAFGGIQKSERFDSIYSFREEVYGTATSDLRQRVRSLVSAWKKIPLERYFLLAASLGVAINARNYSDSQPRRTSDCEDETRFAQRFSSPSTPSRNTSMAPSTRTHTSTGIVEYMIDSNIPDKYYGGFIITPFINATIGDAKFDGYDIMLPSVDLRDIGEGRYSATLISDTVVEVRTPLFPLHYLKDFEHIEEKERRNETYIPELYDAHKLVRVKLRKSKEKNVRIFHFNFPSGLTTKFVSMDGGDDSCKVLKWYTAFSKCSLQLGAAVLERTHDYITWRVLVHVAEKRSLNMNEEKSEMDRLAEQYRQMDMEVERCTGTLHQPEHCLLAYEPQEPSRVQSQLQTVHHRGQIEVQRLNQSISHQHNQPPEPSREQCLIKNQLTHQLKQPPEPSWEQHLIEYQPMHQPNQPREPSWEQRLNEYQPPEPLRVQSQMQAQPTDEELIEIEQEAAFRQWEQMEVQRLNEMEWQHLEKEYGISRLIPTPNKNELHLQPEDANIEKIRPNDPSRKTLQMPAYQHNPEREQQGELPEILQLDCKPHQAKQETERMAGSKALILKAVTEEQSEQLHPEDFNKETIRPHEPSRGKHQVPADLCNQEEQTEQEQQREHTEILQLDCKPHQAKPETERTAGSKALILKAVTEEQSEQLHPEDFNKETIRPHEPSREKHRVPADLCNQEEQTEQEQQGELPEILQLDCKPHQVKPETERTAGSKALMLKAVTGEQSEQLHPEDFNKETICPHEPSREKHRVPADLCNQEEQTEQEQQREHTEILQLDCKPHQGKPEFEKTAESKALLRKEAIEKRMEKRLERQRHLKQRPFTKSMTERETRKLNRDKLKLERERDRETHTSETMDSEYSEIPEQKSVPIVECTLLSNDTSCSVATADDVAELEQHRDRFELPVNAQMQQQPNQLHKEDANEETICPHEPSQRQIIKSPYMPTELDRMAECKALLRKAGIEKRMKKKLDRQHRSKQGPITKPMTEREMRKQNRDKQKQEREKDREARLSETMNDEYSEIPKRKCLPIVERTLLSNEQRSFEESPDSNMSRFVDDSVDVPAGLLDLGAALDAEYSRSMRGSVTSHENSADSK